MKNFIVLFFMVFIVSSLLHPRIEPGYTGSGESDNFTGTFVIQEDGCVRLSIESYREKNGWIPVIISFGDLEVSASVNNGSLAAAASGAEHMISEMLFGDIYLLFDIYEHNPVRTRMRLLDKNMTVTFKINRVEKQAAFYVGNRRLKLAPIRVTFTEIAPGWLYELNFGGKDVYTYSRFIFDSSIGNIYSVCRSLNPLNLETSPIWAKKIDREQERFIKQREGEIK